MSISSIACPGCSQRMVVRRLECPDCAIAVEGRFEPPPLARLSTEEQVFVRAFVRVHGSIKKMEGLFGVSYPTIKNRLNALSAKLDSEFVAPVSRSAILDELAAGEISVEEAIEKLS